LPLIYYLASPTADAAAADDDDYSTDAGWDACTERNDYRFALLL